MIGQVAHIAQEGSRLPATPGMLGSVTRVAHELTERIGRRYPLTVFSTRLPGDAATEQCRGVRHVRLSPGIDSVLLAAAFRWRNRVRRRLGLAERPYPASRTYFYTYIRRIARRLAHERADLVHLHNVSQFAPPLRRVLPQGRIVLHMHCEWLVDLPPRVVAGRLAAVDLVLGVSQHIVGQIAKTFPEVAARCRVLHNGVDLERFPSRERVRAGRSDALERLRARHGLHGPVILYVGRLSSEKGAHVLLEAFARVRRRHPDATCLLVGPDWGPIRKVRAPGESRTSRELHALDRDYMTHLRRLAAPHGPRVVFVGSVPNPEVATYHALADVLAVPSLLEAFGIPALEAAASEVPVVAAATGGLLDIVLPGRTGLLVPAGDAAALAEAIGALLAEPDRARALGRAARQRAAGAFTWDAAADTLAGCYDALLSAAAAGRAA